MHNIYDVPHLVIPVGEYNIIMPRWLDTWGFDRSTDKDRKFNQFQFLICLRLKEREEMYEVMGSLI